MIIGYARVSTEDQTLETQTNALNDAGAEKIFSEKITGAKRDRPQLERMLEHLRKGDVVLVTKFDRLARSLKDLIEIVGKIEMAGAGFKSLAENIDTTSPHGTLTFHIFGAFAQFERDLIVQRTKEGLATARKHGRIGGRRPALITEQREEALAMLKAGKTQTQVARLFGVSLATIKRLAKGS